VYKQQTEPLIEYYETKRILYNVDGTKDINGVFEEVKDVLSKLS